MAKSNNNTKKTNELRPATVYVRGILTDAFYGKKSFQGKKDPDKYRISIKAVPEDMAKLAEVAAPYYEDVDDEYIPKWFKNESDREYLNLASNFDIKAGYKDPATGEIAELGNFIDEYIAENGNINGSKVVVLVIIKEGAIYPGSILIKEIIKQTISDMFADFDDDELPFA